MPLSIQYVTSLDAVVDEAVEFLSQPMDIFTSYKIVIPTIGARSWLADKLARRLGSTDTPVSYTHLTLPTNREV